MKWEKRKHFLFLVKSKRISNKRDGNDHQSMNDKRVG